jgi:hypothetical protein
MSAGQKRDQFFTTCSHRRNKTPDRIPESSTVSIECHDINPPLQTNCRQGKIAGMDGDRAPRERVWRSAPPASSLPGRPAMFADAYRNRGTCRDCETHVDKQDHATARDGPYRLTRAATHPLPVDLISLMADNQSTSRRELALSPTCHPRQGGSPRQWDAAVLRAATVADSASPP